MLSEIKLSHYALLNFRYISLDTPAIKNNRISPARHPESGVAA